jgi:hypothetical protein
MILLASLVAGIRVYFNKVFYLFICLYLNQNYFGFGKFDIYINKYSLILAGEAI